MNRGEIVLLDGERCIVVTGWGEGVKGVAAAYRRLRDGQRFLWTLDGIVAVAG